MRRTLLTGLALLSSFAVTARAQDDGSAEDATLDAPEVTPAEPPSDPEPVENVAPDDDAADKAEADLEAAEKAAEEKAEADKEAAAKAAEEKAEADEKSAEASKAAEADKAAAGQPALTATAPSNELFGQYRIRVGMARPNFNDGLKFYDKLYGDEKWYPTFGVDWYPWDYYVTAGLSFRFGLYTADGHAAKSTSGKPKEDLTEDDIIKDENGPTSLTLIPLQIALTTEFTPFSRKFVVIDAWLGFEQIYYQEVRTADTGTKSTTPSTSTSFSLAEPAAASDDTLTNKGWKTATTLGVSANILLNALDDESVRSMRGTMGLGYVYLSPFLEIARTLSKEGASFGRTSLGVGFTFESAR